MLLSYRPQLINQQCKLIDWFLYECSKIGFIWVVCPGKCNVEDIKKSCNIVINAYDTTPYSKCDQASDLWQQLELTTELESDLRDTMD